MSKIGEYIQEADWKKEKHAPVIEVPTKVKAGEPFTVEVSVGKEIPHPNTAEHHIAWIDVFFQPEGNKFLYQVARFEFSAHGEVNTFTEPMGTFTMKVDKPGTIRALSLCNIHGLWESSVAIEVE